MRTLRLVSTFVVACVTWVSLTPFVSASSRPNIVVILTDDQGWGDLSLNGNKNLSTPNIDSLAKNGVQFDRFYVCPVCSPTRAEFLTGRYHPRGDVYSTSAGGERLDLDEMTIAEVLKAAGYITGAFGKWHNGMQFPYHPNGRGFDEYYGFCSGHWGNYFSPMLERNGKIVKGKGFLVDDLTNKAMEFMTKNKKRPFFAYIPYNTPHSPMQVPDRWWEKFKNDPLKMRHREARRENLGHTRAALAMCENIDWNVGRILQKLQDLGIADNTIVIFFCDNGPNGRRWNGGMKGRKGSTDEGGVRSPLLIRWPDGIKGGRTIVPIAGAIDLLPTIADLADVKFQARKPLDGMSLKPLLTGACCEWPDRMIFSHWRGRVSVRTQQYRLDNNGNLFDMKADPGQDKNIAKQNPQIVKKLQNAAAAWRKDVLADYQKSQRPFLIGHPKYQYTQLPARDGEAFGKIKRSNRFPNCSFFTNWKSTKDKITWDVEVGANGEYDVELYYTCPKADVGLKIKLSLGQAHVTAKITKPHDPPLRGAENDRVKRIEAYVKDFKPMSLGTIRLKRGRGKLILRATEIPGSQAMDFRLLMFTRKGSAN
ncbi:MAG: arylsulfatase [Gemmataceae bacterium]